MTASPAQVANDLAAQGRYFHRRDDDVSRICQDAAHLIRTLEAGGAMDGRTFGDIHSRLIDRCRRYPADSQIGKSLMRGMQTLTVLAARGSV